MNKFAALFAGEMFGVPKGVKHRPLDSHECKILLIEPRGVVNPAMLVKRLLLGMTFGFDHMDTGRNCT